MSFFLNLVVFEYDLDTPLYLDNCQVIDTLATVLLVELKESTVLPQTSWATPLIIVLYHQISSKHAFALFWANAL
jgi:hypothetical protein